MTRKAAELIDGTGRYRLPITAQALIRAEKKERQKMATKDPAQQHIRPRVSKTPTRFAIQASPAFAQQVGRMGKPSLRMDADYIYLTVKADPAGNVGNNGKGKKPYWIWSWNLPQVQKDSPNIPDFRTLDAQLLDWDNNEQQLKLRIPRTRLLPPIDRSGKLPEPPKAPNPLAKVHVRELVRELNSRLDSEAGLSFRIGEDGKLLAAIMVEYS